MTHSTIARPLALAALLTCACATAGSQQTAADKAPRGKPTAEEAKAFVGKLDGELKRLIVRSSTAEWIKSNFITEDTERNAASANEELVAYTTQAIQEAARFDGLEVDPVTRRMLDLLKLGATLPAPSDPKKRAELTTISARMEGLYGKGKWCPPGKSGDDCLDLGAIEDILKTSRKEPELRAAWEGWHQIAVELRPLYERMVALGNEGAKEIGFGDVGQIWRAGYDMPVADLEKEIGRLYQQTKPLYDALHCHVRAKLAEKYGEQVVPAGKPIPAHLFGNMWAQTWDNIYPLVEPYPGAVNLDVDSKLKAGNYDAKKMTRLAESFFTSLGMDPLPKTFWERSLFTKPRDRDVVCHASAWDVTSDGDLRIKMCIKPTEEELSVLHHELGHDYYYMQYYKLPILFQQGANDGFHEAIGDAIVHSVTPAYLKKVGLLDELPKDQKGLLNVQMKEALARVSFLPFGYLIDQWRWDVFSGKTPPSQYNAAWWALREKLQGVRAPSPRTEGQFDAGAKYHVASGTPYLRYFIAAILQYQFHRALCKTAGHTGPLHECSIHGNKAAGEKLRAMLAMGASRPWQEALFTLSGEKAMDATALLDYFAPLKTWLDEQNAGRKCGWQ